MTNLSTIENPVDALPAAWADVEPGSLMCRGPIACARCIDEERNYMQPDYDGVDEWDEGFWDDR